MIAGVTHCGLGGAFEFITSLTPTLTFPHFGDQTFNAQNLIDAGAAIELIPSVMGDRNLCPANLKFDNQLFSPEDFASKLEEILTNKKYRMNMLRLKTAAKTQGGAKKAIETIQNVYINYAFAIENPKPITDVDYKFKYIPNYFS